MSKDKIEARARRKKSIRKRISGDAERPRLSVYRSNKHIYAQVINDVDSRSLVLVSDLTKELAEQLRAAGEAPPPAPEPAEGEEPAAGPEGTKIRVARVVGAAAVPASGAWQRFADNKLIGQDTKYNHIENAEFLCRGCGLPGSSAPDYLAWLYLDSRA